MAQARSRPNTGLRDRRSMSRRCLVRRKRRLQARRSRIHRRTRSTYNQLDEHLPPSRGHPFRPWDPGVPGGHPAQAGRCFPGDREAPPPRARLGGQPPLWDRSRRPYLAVLPVPPGRLLLAVREVLRVLGVPGVPARLAGLADPAAPPGPCRTRLQPRGMPKRSAQTSAPSGISQRQKGPSQRVSSTTFAANATFTPFARLQGRSECDPGE